MRVLCFFVILFCISCNKEEKKEILKTKVQKGDVRSALMLAGKVQPARQLSLTAPFDTPVYELIKASGDAVENGEVMAKMDSAAIDKEVADAKLSLQQNESKITNEEIRLSALRKDLAATKKLYRSGAVSLSDKQKKEDDYTIAQNQFNVAKSELSIRKKRLAELLAQKENVDLKSPFKGVVTMSWKTKDEFSPGMSVKKGDLLFKVASLDKMQIEISVTESQVVKIHKGMEVDVTFSALNETVKGKISYIDSAAKTDESSGVSSFKVMIDFPPVEKLKTGMEARVKASYGRANNTVRIEKNAVHSAGTDHSFVFIYKDGMPEKRPVELGLIGDIFVQIKSGLEEGDEVVLNHE